MDAIKERLLRKLKTPLYSVVEEWDGCPMETVYPSMPRESCLIWMRQHWRKYNQGKGSLMLVNHTTGRAESFLL